MALDVSAFITTELPEVTALKRKVAEVAKAYAVRHNWCEVVDQALAEMGINPTGNKVMVKVTTTYGLEFTVSIDPVALHEKSDAEQRAALVEKIGRVAYSSGGGARAGGTLTIPPEAVADMELLLEQNDDNWWYASQDGRVMHWFRKVNSDWLYAACGASANRIDITKSSARGENRRCAKCSERHPEPRRRRPLTDRILAA